MSNQIDNFFLGLIDGDGFQAVSLAATMLAAWASEGTVSGEYHLQNAFRINLARMRRHGVDCLVSL